MQMRSVPTLPRQRYNEGLRRKPGCQRISEKVLCFGVTMIRLLILISVLWIAENAQGCPKIVRRSEWGARKGTCAPKLVTPVPGVIIHHTTGSFCNNRQSCVGLVKGIQKYHMNSNKWCNIGYNFLIGEDGAVYEGAGWTTVGTHAKGFNSRSIGIGFIGTFTNRAPNAAALNAAKSLISCGVAQKFIRPDYRLRGHRNVNPTACPGNALYKVIQRWARFKA